jgi:signal transduction histidine kinase
MFIVLSSTFSFFMYNYLSQILYRAEEGIIRDEISYILNNLVITYDDRNDSYDFNPVGLLGAKTGLSIFDLSGNTVFSDTRAEIIELPIEGERFRELTLDDLGVLIYYDEPIYFKDEIVGWLRLNRSISHITNTLFNIRVVIFTATPIYILFATLSSLFLTSRALTPIDSITKTANIIEKGDLSKRITMPKVNDEVGRLARTFNKMIERIENSFSKEKRFTSDASHELKTPISIISATAEQALKKGRNTKDYKNALTNIIDESKKVSYLISQLLFLARSDEGKEILNLEYIDLTLIAESVVGQLKEMAEKKEIKISIELEHDFKLESDQTLMTILFLNIIENSIKYNKTGGFLNISLHKEENDIKIIFEDNGIGISTEDLPYIFDRFYQVSRSRTGRGSGLGLAITKEIIELHNGEINVDSLLGKGTRLEISLPLDLVKRDLSV